MTNVVLGFVIGPALVLAGWAAWTGRWRAWAHPYSGRGLLPLLALPFGFSLCWAPFVSGNDAAWTGIVALPALVALPVALLNLFHDFKRWPPLLRPRWLPADAPVPVLRDPRATPALIGLGRVETSSEELATQGAGAPGRRLAHWEVLYAEQNPAVPYLNVAGTGIRIARLDVYETAVTLYQQSMEDRLHGANFAFVFHPGDVQKLDYRPAPKFSWRALLQPRQHLSLPRLVLRTSDGSHEVMVRDPKFRRDLGPSLDLLARALQVGVST